MGRAHEVPLPVLDGDAFGQELHELRGTLPGDEREVAEPERYPGATSPYGWWDLFHDILRSPFVTWLR